MRCQCAEDLRRVEPAVAVEDQIELAVADRKSGCRPFDHLDAERSQPCCGDGDVRSVRLDRDAPRRRPKRTEDLASAGIDVQDSAR